MTERIRLLIDILKEKSYRTRRVHDVLPQPDKSLRNPRIAAFAAFLDAEAPQFFEGDRIGFYRHRAPITFDNDWYAPYGNIVPNYVRYLEKGFGGVYADMKKKSEGDSDEAVFAADACTVLGAMKRYFDKQKNAASGELRKVLTRAPWEAPQTYHEALIVVKAVQFFLRCNRTIHVPIGRFDQYMYPFFKADIERGVPLDELFALTEEFFLSLNFDADLYEGVQIGDNGQSLVLGGFDEDGKYCFNELSKMCLDASIELNLIDPKINIRVGKDTPAKIYALGTRLTKKGLGFPQYCNDDVVIPALIGYGYDKKDAYNYAVAACWEFIASDNAHDIPNFAVMNFPKVVNDVIHEKLGTSESFDALLDAVRCAVGDECKALLKHCDELFEADNRGKSDTVFSLFIDCCLDGCFDCTDDRVKYRNYGFHGTGISNATDALAAVKKCVYEDRTVSKEELLDALDADFAGHEETRQKLTASPKMGNADEYADSLADVLMDAFCVGLQGLRSSRGGIIRPGTGSAMEYILSARAVAATADGRNAYTPFASSFSPAITTKLDGPLSVIRSFTRFDMKRICNGGPLTMEIHDNVFRSEVGESKVADMVRCFILLGGHQLQLNAINRDVLLDAEAHPENYPNLIVRVWGWSGYFTELDTEYRKHIIARTEFTV